MLAVAWHFLAVFGGPVSFVLEEWIPRTQSKRRQCLSIRRLTALLLLSLAGRLIIFGGIAGVCGGYEGSRVVVAQPMLIQRLLQMPTRLHSRLRAHRTPIAIKNGVLIFTFRHICRPEINVDDAGVHERTLLVFAKFCRRFFDDHFRVSSFQHIHFILVSHSSIFVAI